MHVLESLRRAGTVRWLTLMLQNEPLLDPDLHKRVAVAKRVLGAQTKVTTVTNGTLLSSHRIGELLAAGIDRISTYRRLRRFRPRLLIGYAGVLFDWVRLLGPGRRSLPGLRAIITSAEVLHDHWREVLGPDMQIDFRCCDALPTRSGKPRLVISQVGDSSSQR